MKTLYQIEVDKEPIIIKLLDQHNLGYATINIIPSARSKGFDIEVTEMSALVSCKIGDYNAGSF
jgi:hypothetical protein